jgi:hypothetical protein
LPATRQEAGDGLEVAERAIAARLRFGGPNEVDAIEIAEKIEA